MILLCAAGGDVVDETTTDGIVSLTPTGHQTTRLPSALTNVGVFYPDGVVAGPDDTIYADQDGPGAPAIVSVHQGKVRVLWAADV
ncbi:MAG: hypothetical protein ACRD0Z_14445 [Acidimicrobiales bacterium]